MTRIALSLTAAGAALALLVAVPALSTSAAVQAQSTATPAPAATPAPVPTVPVELKPLFEGVTLTPAQINQVVAIHQKYPAPTSAPIDSTKAGMGAGAVDHRADEAKELRAILTAEQQKLFDKNLATVKTTWKKPGY